MHLFSVDIQNLLNLPCYVFWKDTDGVYLGYNDFGAVNLGYESGEEIVGKTDFEIFPKDAAKFFRENDGIVRAEEKQIFVPEVGVLKNNVPVVFLSYKMPTYDQNGVLTGVAGISFARPVCDIQGNSRKNTLITELTQSCNTRINPELNTFDFSTLSEKERACLHHLCQGMTVKMIAKQLGISPKTVETYLERSKIKTNCHNKTELMSAYIRASIKNL